MFMVWINNMGVQMVAHKKSVNIGVFNILNSIMNAKAAKLRATIDAGRRAEQERPVLYEHISHLQQYIISNRYDRNEVLDAEMTMNDYEQQASAINTKIDMGKAAQSNLQYVDKFKNIYNSVVVAPKLRELNELYGQISARMDVLDERMFGCEINMNPYERSASIVEQSETDMEMYQAEYAQLSERLNDVLRQMALYQNTK